MSRWLISHFAPFNGAETNSSQIAAELLKPLEPKHVFAKTLPVSFTESWTALERQLTPDIDGVLALGQAEGRKVICLERIALNWIDASIPDEHGNHPVDCKIDEAGSELWTTVPVRELISPPTVELSYSAGTYVCNFLYYRGLQWAKAHNKRFVFVHLPLLESQAEDAFANHFKMPVDQAVQALQTVIKRLA